MDAVRGASEAPHGKYARYVAGCRCDACKAANRDYVRAYRRRGKDREVRGRLGDCAPGLGWPRYPGEQAGRRVS